MIKKIFCIVFFTGLTFALTPPSNGGDDDATKELKGEYKWQPPETASDRCHCNVGYDTINRENIIPFEKNINKEISQSIIDTKNTSMLIVSEWLRGLGAETYSQKIDTDFYSTMMIEEKQNAFSQEKKSKKACVDLDLQIANLNSTIINAEMKLAELKAKSK